VLSDLYINGTYIIKITNNLEYDILHSLWNWKSFIFFLPFSSFTMIIMIGPSMIIFVFISMYILYWIFRKISFHILMMTSLRMVYRTIKSFIMASKFAWPINKTLLFSYKYFRYCIHFLKLMYQSVVLKQCSMDTPKFNILSWFLMFLNFFF